MTLEHLWAGWRAAYVGSSGDAAGESGSVHGAASEPGSAQPVPGEHDPSCVFCEIFVSVRPDAERLVVRESAQVVVVMNAYPYASGHVMVMPRRHVRGLEDLSKEEEAEIWPAVKAAAAALKAAYHPDGCNIGMNLGRAAGAGIPGHLHVHVVPRWLGDTNFMTVTSGTRVLPEALADSWAKLRAAWAGSAPPAESADGGTAAGWAGSA